MYYFYRCYDKLPRRSSSGREGFGSQSINAGEGLVDVTLEQREGRVNTSGEHVGMEGMPTQLQSGP